MSVLYGYFPFGWVFVLFVWGLVLGWDISLFVATLSCPAIFLSQWKREYGFFEPSNWFPRSLL
jgi:hypothetical protein